MRSLHDTIARMQKFDKVEDEIVQQRKTHMALADMVDDIKEALHEHSTKAHQYN